MNCISCGSKKLRVVLDFGKIPISNNFVKFKDIEKIKKYKLGLLLCTKCFLIQNSKIINNKKIFNKDYLYHSSCSKSWLDHSKKLSEYCIKNFNLNQNSKVLEIASNDGYLLKFFQKKKINVFGIEPSKSVAKIAIKKGIKTFINFFSYKFIKKINNIIQPDIIIALNVLAHTPKLNDFVLSLSLIMNENNICIIEVPYLVNLLKKKQIDTIYHEHYSYFSLLSLMSIFKKYSLEVFDIKQIKTHGGSIRIFLKKKNNSNFKVSSSIKKLIYNEKKIGLRNIGLYKRFSTEIYNLIKKNENKIKLLCDKNKVLGYGAAAKATIAINLLKLKNSHINYIFDQNKFKQSRFIPGTKIKILNPKYLKKNKPSHILIFVWNIKNEIIKYIKTKLKYNCKFITLNPNIKIS
jgi:2-polyprenyl-3-methyl-5-hydroxy-6-metoxy-1,4-benzoquinol methylase